MKTLEIRDSMTFIPVMAVRSDDVSDIAKYYFRRLGYNSDHVIVTRLDTLESQYSEYAWKAGTRTMLKAHEYIRDNYSVLKDGDVVDVQHILGETFESKTTERLLSNALNPK